VPLRIDTLTVDAHEPSRLAEFWAAALGFVIEPSDETDEVVIASPEGSAIRILFGHAPDDKVVKNRLHLDLRPRRLRSEEVERLQSLGAIVLEGFGGPNATWTVMQDPEGNEFCVLRGPDDPVPPGGQKIEPFDA
jgi:hypothetical protein